MATGHGASVFVGSLRDDGVYRGRRFDPRLDAQCPSALSLRGHRGLLLGDDAHPWGNERVALRAAPDLREDDGARTDANAAHERIDRAFAARDRDAADRAKRRLLEEVAAHYWQAVDGDATPPGRGAGRRRKVVAHERGVNTH